MHDILTGEVGECVTNANWYFVTMRGTSSQNEEMRSRKALRPNRIIGTV